MKTDEYSSFVRVLFGLTTASPVSGDLKEEKDLEWVDPSLNDSQKDAIKFALASREVALIHGPPGASTGFIVDVFSVFSSQLPLCFRNVCISLKYSVSSLHPMHSCF